MSIERSITPYVAFADDSLLSTLAKINANKARTIFLVDEHGVLQGSLTDGDVRRWLTAGNSNMETSAIKVANRSPRTVTEGTLVDELDWKFRDGVSLVPVLDTRGRMVAIASPTNDSFTVGSHRVGKDQPTFVIAEIGNNHQGNVDLAKQLVDLAA